MAEDTEVQTTEEVVKPPEPVYTTYVDVMMGKDAENQTTGYWKKEGATAYSIKEALAYALGITSTQVVIQEVIEEWNDGGRYWSSDRLCLVFYRIYGSKVLMEARLKSRCNQY